MNNFRFHNPTRIHFGKGQIETLANEIPSTAKILMTYGGGSIKSNGVYDQVLRAVNGRSLLEFSGIEPNPTYETLMKAVEVVKREKIDFLLAVGGGSVLDGTKFIAAAALWENNSEGGNDPWTILTGDAPVKKALPFGAVLTLPATGSEMNSGAVITRKSTNDKLAFGSPLLFPRFSILDPTTTFSLPPRQIGNGVVDAFVHIMEQYLTYPAKAAVQDRISEGLLQTLIEEGPNTLENPTDYDSRANMMWAATLALNGLIGAGVPQDWTTHMIGHELTALYGLDHAQTLAIVFPAVMNIMRKQKGAKILQYGARVWGIHSGTESEKIDQAIAKTKQFFESLHVPTTLTAYKIDRSAVAKALEGLKRHEMTEMGETGAVSVEVSAKILESCF
ncbi:iron-containing alcohol dehydrogenase [Bdellovibrionota bacterium FG-2]